jgi:peroxiredoxin Q/BCP
MATRTDVGDRAPTFRLKTQKGDEVSLDDLTAKGPVVVFFYPKDETAGCTAEACAFRDAFEDFCAAGASVVGISSDSVGSHDRFANRHKLPFLLMADEGGKVRSAFGVPKTLGIMPGRVTYVIDRKGVVRHVFNSQIQAGRHVEEALAVVRRLASEAAA